MRQIDPNYHRWIGKRLIDVSAEIQAECDRHRYTLSVLDPEFNPRNIDVEPHRLNVHVDGNSIIRKLEFS